MMAEAHSRSDIQGLRGVAVLLVVGYHADLPIPGGFFGVDVFFVVSGFVITSLLLNELAESHRLHLRLFFARRVRRLLPALSAMLLAVVAAAWFVLTPLGLLQDTVYTGLGTSLFSANIVLLVISGGYFANQADSNPLLHAWTLAVEEQFYLVFPLLLLLGWRLRGRRGALLVIAAGGMLSLAACLYLTYASGPPLQSLDHNRRLAFFASPTRGWEFVAGALIALTEPQTRRLPATAAKVAWGLGGVALVASVLVLDASLALPGVATLVPVLGTCLLIVAGGAKVSGPLRRWPLTWIGDVSYGWYLWHWPAIVFTRLVFSDVETWALVLVGTLALVPAWLSFRFLEEPIRRRRDIVGWRAVRLAAVCVVVPAVALSALGVAGSRPSEAVRELQTQGRPHLDQTRGCMDNLPGTPATAQCTWGPEERVVLLGDSNAGHFAEPIRAVAKSHGLGFQVASKGACPFSDLRTFAKDRAFDTDGCARFIDAWTTQMQDEPPALVVLANFSGRYLADDDIVFATPDDTTTSTQSDRAAAWSSGLRRLVDSWAAVGVPTLVVNPIPDFAGFNLRECPKFRVNQALAACAMTRNTAEVIATAEQARAAELRAVEDVRAATTLDLTPEICPGRECSTFRDGMFIYRDEAHISVPFSLSLIPVFDQAMQKPLRASGLVPEDTR